MNCPKCNSEMELGTEVKGEWGHECHECGCVVCQNCGKAFVRLEEADVTDTHTGKDFYCPNCGSQIYSVDLYGE
jgi:DNA-directed RNA polymerase subunit RPC12/RpoP